LDSDSIVDEGYESDIRSPLPDIGFLEEVEHGVDNDQEGCANQADLRGLEWLEVASFFHDGVLNNWGDDMEEQ
jgi:hypothetical protein